MVLYELINKFSEVAGYKINTQKPMYFCTQEPVEVSTAEQTWVWASMKFSCICNLRQNTPFLSWKTEDRGWW